MSSNAPKVAILGFHLESNAFSPLSVEADFLAQCWEQGEDITRLARGASRLPSEVPGFYARMDELGAWTPAPLIVIGAPPGGPASAGVWRRFLAEAETRLRAALPVDAVYVANHGASSAEGQDDTEGELMGRLRAIVGPGVPIVPSHDLHCNVSEQTVQALDGLISYRTNPHVDQRERAADAADMIHEILGGTRMVSAYVRLPLTPPSVTLLTSSGPYADLVALGASLIQKPDEGPIANVSVCSGFVFSDLPKCGLTITVTARGDLQAARRAALRIARAGW
ncbi:M81 family metallopeptidase, partial [Bordetella pertussis]|uniref:M81 family metallopeptidase n=1 Tax=Bordetella pertussis TaxID=520 RepID=UPI000B1936BE